MDRYALFDVAIGNAIEQLKQDADYMTTSVDEDGIRNALRHFGLTTLWILAVLMSMTVQNTWAQRITDMGHATLTVRKQVVTNVELDTPVGTAARRQQDHTRAERSGFYDKAINEWLDMWWFTYQYPSVSGDGQPITLSALACMPDNDEGVTAVNNVIVGCHATISANWQCPSEFNRTGMINSDVFMMMYHAGSTLIFKAPQSDQYYHNLVILPDYEGYGVSKDRAHPYLCEEATARQVTDAVRYGISLYQTDEQVSSIRHPFRDDWRTICEGYSQGGAVAMATQRYIEQNGLTEELRLAGSVCGDGPYDPMVTILYYMEKDLQGEALSMPVVLPLILKGLCDYDDAMTGRQVSDYLEKRFLETGIIDWLTDKEKNTDEITDSWIKLYKNGKDGDENYFREVLTSSGKAYLKNILKPAIYDYFQQLLEQNPDYGNRAIALPRGGTPAEDLHLALEHNNLTRDWKPEHLVCLFHSTADKVVPFPNCQSALASFGDQVKFYESALNGNHGETGTEFFTISTRDECIRMLAKEPYKKPTAIEPTIKQTEDNTKWYDIYGRTIQGKPRKGIYIKNGKKVIVT